MSTTRTQTPPAGTDKANKPVARASIPVTDDNGKTRWIDAGPVWATKDGDGQILDIQAVPVSHLTDGIPADFRILIKPVDQD